MAHESLTGTAQHLSKEITDHYQILKLLGRGGMGDVYLAKQLRVNRLVALKVLKRSFTEDPDINRRFENEAVAAGQLDHPNIVRIYDCRLTGDGQLFVAMEYLEGENLKNLIRNQGPLSLPKTVSITNQIASGLAAAHQAEIVHRDIKPDNIMLSNKGAEQVVKILDFGIARLQATATDSQTVTGNVLGSASYMSPEQAEGLTGGQIDARADIYSLGMVVYEMLTGRVAFKSPSWAELVHKQRFEAPPFPRIFRPDLPVKVEAAVLRALAKNREDRQQTATDFAAELEEAASNNIDDSSETTRLSLPVEVDSLSVMNKEPLLKTTDLGKESEENDSAKTQLSSKEKTRSVRKIIRDVIAAVLAGVLLIFLGFYINHWLSERKRPESEAKSPGVKPPALPISVMKYEVMRKDASPDLITLPADNTFHSGEEISFRLMLARPGIIYLLHKSKDGSMKWVNAGANNQPQFGRAEEWLNIPDENWIGTKGMERERFLLIYVPMGIQWSLEGVVYPQNIDVGRSGFPEFQREAAERIAYDLKAKAAVMASSSSQNGREVIHQLVLPADNNSSIAYYEFELKGRQ